MTIKTFYAMGCHIKILLEDGERDPESCLEPVPQWFEEWESILSRFRPGSELSRLNLSKERIHRVGPILGAVLGEFLACGQTDGRAGYAARPRCAAFGGI